MRKKIKILFILLFFVSALSFAQTITVTDPHSGDTWNKGNTYTIRWTKSGSMNANVKIRLMQGGRKVLAITDSTANDGSYSWTVPSSVANGSYYIRVKTIDNAVYDDGEVFTISDQPAANITVTDPHSGDTWNKGNTYTIRWTKSGSMNANVKIRLMQGGRKVLAITDSTTNSGSYSWTVPSSVANGSYYIRVKTIDNAVYDDGDEFNIKEKSGSTTVARIVRQYGNVRAFNDFEIKDIFYSYNIQVYNHGGWVAVKIKNYVNNFDGNLKFRVFFPDTDTSLTHPLNYTKHLNMRVGEEKTIYLVPIALVGEVPLCGKRVRVMIDPDNEIVETKENNNSIEKKIYTKRADFNITISDLKLLKTYLISTHKWRVKFKIHVRAGGSGYTSLSNVYTYWDIAPRGEEGVLFSEIPVPSFTINLNEEKVVSVDKKFGHPDLDHSIRPRLKAGYYVITVKVMIFPRNCENAMTLGTRRFSIHLH